jgi:hypothetical protein
MALLRANTGIGITNPIVALHVDGDALFTGIVSATTFYGNVVGIATSAVNLVGGVQGSLPYQSTVNSTTFLSPGVAGQVLITNGAGQNPTWVSSSALSGSFTGLTIKDEGTIVGSAASVSSINFVGPNVVATASGAGATITLSNDAQYLTGTAPGSVISQSSGLTVTGNLSISGNLSVGGTSVILNAATLQIKDKDIVAGITTNALNQDVSTDTSANHGGIAIASTEGTPLIDIVAGVGTDSVPYTYKQIMWLKSGSWTGLGTDAWLFNYGVGIGSTQVPNGVRLAVGGVQFTQNDLSVVRNINASGIITATQFVGSLLGNVTSADYAKVAGIATYANSSGIATYSNISGFSTFSGYSNTAGIATYTPNAGISTNVIGGIASITSLSVSGISTLGTVKISSGIITASTGIVTYYGDGSGLTNINIGSIAGAIIGITIRDEGTTVGTASSITSLNFVGGNVVATASGVGATITIADNLVGTALSISGISTFTNGPVLIGAATSTGTSSQKLQVTGGAYISTSTGIGTTNPLQSLHVLGNLLVAAGSSTGQHITQKAYELNSGTLSWEGTAGQLFSITNNLTSGSIFSVNDVSGIPSIDVDASGTVSLVAYGGNVAIGSTGLTGTASQKLQVSGGGYLSGSLGIGTTNPSQSLHIQGNARLTGALYDSSNATGSSGQILSSTGSAISWINASTTNVGSANSIAITADSTNASRYLTFVSTTSGNNIVYVDSDLLYNPSTNSLAINSTTFTGTSSQNLQVTGGAYVSGNLGIGTTRPTSALQVQGNVLVSGISTFSNQIISTQANSTADGGGQIYLNGATGNRIDFVSAGVGAPSVTTRSVGTKLVLYPGVGASTVDYGLGIDTNILWSSVPGSSQQFKWYAGTTNIATLKGTGELILGTTTLTGTASQPLQVTGGAYVSGNLGVGRANPAGVSSAFAEIYYESGDPANATTALQVGMGAYTPNTNTIRQYGIKVNQLGGRYAPQTGIRIDIPGTAGLFNGSGTPYYGIEAYTICSNQASQKATSIVGVSSNTDKNYGNLNIGVEGTANSGTNSYIATYGAILEGAVGGKFVAYGKAQSIGVYADAYLLASPGAGQQAIPFLAASNGTELLRITSAGNLLVGTATSTGTASQPLQVTGGAYVSGSLGIGITNPIGLTTGSAQTLHLNGTTAVLRVGPYYSAGGDRDNILLVADGADTYLRSNNERFHIYNNSGDILLHGTSDVENICITASGNVGIGTVTPRTKLDVAGGGYFTGFTNPTSSGRAGLEIGYDGSQGIVQCFDRPNGVFKNIQYNGTEHIFSGGNIKVGSGYGIDFSATTDAGGMTSELLADYEEGTWTPRISGTSGGDYTPGSNNVGRYVKVGRIVTASATVHWTASVTPYSGLLTLTGLPYSSLNVSSYRAAGSMPGQNVGVYGDATYPLLAIGIDWNNSFVYIIKKSETITSGNNYSHYPSVNSAGNIYGFTITYISN